MAKIFVLDTNIILHDHNAIKHARAFMREMNKLMDRKPGLRGYSLGKKLGCIKLEPNHPFTPKYQEMFRDDIQDHRILSTAMWVRDHNPNRFVALVTKDINLRLKAKAVGMEAQDYLRDRVDDEVMISLEKEVITIEVSSEATQRLAYGQDNCLPWQEVQDQEPKPNQLYKFVFGGETVCARYDASRKVIALVRAQQAAGIPQSQDSAGIHHRRRRYRQDAYRPGRCPGAGGGL